MLNNPYPSDYEEKIRHHCENGGAPELNEQPYLSLYQAFNEIHQQSANAPYSNLDKYHISPRYPSNVHTLKKPPFMAKDTEYPAVPILTDEIQQTSDVLAEGPTADNFANLLAGLAKLNINILIPVGVAFDNSKQQEKFFNYMGKANQISLIEFLTKATHKQPIPTEFITDANELNFKFYRFDNGRNGDFYIMHVLNWDDHALPKFTEIEKKVLAWYFAYGKSACYHCSAGVGRSVSLLLAKMFFRNLYQQQIALDQHSIITYFKKAVAEIKRVKPLAGGATDGQYQLMMSPGLAQEAYNYISTLTNDYGINNAITDTGSETDRLLPSSEEESHTCQCRCTLI